MQTLWEVREHRQKERVGNAGISNVEEKERKRPIQSRLQKYDKQQQLPRQAERQQHSVDGGKVQRSFHLPRQGAQAFP